MTDEPIATLYRKPCPSCGRQYARDSRACPFCGYAETAVGDHDEDQDRLYGEYLVARHRQYQDELKRLRLEAQRAPHNPGPARVLAQVEAEILNLERDLKAYQDKVSLSGRFERSEQFSDCVSGEGESEPLKSRTRQLDPPERAVGDKVCPACKATVPHVIGRCACGHVFGAEVTALAVCPHCTATVEDGAARCRCGYPLTAGASLSSIPVLSKG